MHPAGLFLAGHRAENHPFGNAVGNAIAGSLSYFARALALALGPVRVNVVSPGWVDTPMWDKLVGEAKVGFFADMAARLSSGRIPTAADVVTAYLR